MVYKFYLIIFRVPTTLIPDVYRYMYISLEIIKPVLRATPAFSCLDNGYTSHNTGTVKWSPIQKYFIIKRNLIKHNFMNEFSLNIQG